MKRVGIDLDNIIISRMFASGMVRVELDILPVVADYVEDVCGYAVTDRVSESIRFRNWDLRYKLIVFAQSIYKARRVRLYG